MVVRPTQECRTSVFGVRSRLNRECDGQETLELLVGMIP